MKVKRLLPHSVPGENQFAFFLIPYCTGKHPRHFRDKLLLFLLVQMNHHLTVAIPLKLMSSFLQLGPKFYVVINLPIRHCHNRAILVEKWLLPIL